MLQHTHTPFTFLFSQPFLNSILITPHLIQTLVPNPTYPIPYNPIIFTLKYLIKFNTFNNF